MTLDEELVKLNISKNDIAKIKQAFQDAGYQPPVENKMLTTDNGV